MHIFALHLGPEADSPCIGRIEIVDPRFIEDKLDCAITPTVSIPTGDPDTLEGRVGDPLEPVLTRFHLGRRTELDPRVREDKWPYRHLGGQMGNEPDPKETEEWEKITGKELD
jgi:hypothetical protein